jgi:hypothetical protein
MTYRQAKYRRNGVRRQVIVLIAALSLCLNALLPAVVMAKAANASESVVICTPDGYKTVRLDQDGTPAQQGHEGSGCAHFFGCGMYVGLATTASATTAPGALFAIRPRQAPRRSSTDKWGGEPRGPPYLV